MNKLLYCLLLFITIFFYSCKTDIDVNADYKDIPIVYGIISPVDSVHYIKINKAFLGDANALDLAANANNFNYADGELTVTVDELNTDGSIAASYILTKTVNEIPKEQGIFDNQTNVLYKFIEPNINRVHTYQLKIRNNLLDKNISSQTQIVENTSVTGPVNHSQKFNFWNGSVATGNFLSKIIRVSTGANAGRIQAKLIFNYIEHYTTASGLASTYKKVEMIIGETKTTTSLGGESIEWEMKGETFFDNISSNVSQPSSVPFFSHRELDNISLEFSIAGTELSTYMEVTAPSTSVNQDKPNYTNITNGIGIFSSREKLIWVSTIDPAGGNVNMNNSTITYLQSLNLGFCFGIIGTGFPVAPCTQL